MEQLFAALVARAIHTLHRDTAESPARADVFVLPEGLLERPDAASSGWRHIAALVVVTTRWPWSLDEEDQRVATDAFRAAGPAGCRHRPAPAPLSTDARTASLAAWRTSPPTPVRPPTLLRYTGDAQFTALCNTL